MIKLNHLDIYKKLDKTNCRKCGLPACMAFAVSVIKGDRDIKDCPTLEPDVIKEIEGKLSKLKKKGDDLASIEPLKKEVEKVDFSLVADGIGGELLGSRIRIKCLGKDFTVHSDGNLESGVHINTWIMTPLLRYIIKGGTGALSGRWIAFEELNKGATVAGYFHHRCEDPLQQIADSHIAILSDLIAVFGGRNADGYTADYAWIIYPLPKVPFLVLYYRAEDEFESKLQILFDSATDTFLDAHSIYVLGRGIVEMFKKIIANHEELLPTLRSL